MRILLSMIAAIFLIVGIATVRKPHAIWMPPNGSMALIHSGDAVSEGRSRVYGYLLLAVGGAIGVAAIFWTRLVPKKDGADRVAGGS